MDYRREIDGLRALAVLPVILFHAGFETFSGGFVGVDVFFVISGYLITTIILAELEQGKFSIVNFYERRARRILPTLFLVMLVCFPFAWFWLLPSDMKDFSQSLAAVSVFASNSLFLLESGYFDTSAELKPLLHTWSLAVEEQYYVLFPLLLMLFWKLGKHWILALLGILSVTSLALAQWAVYAKPEAAFYLLPTRGWELLIGGFAAFYLFQAKRKDFSKATCEVAGWLGVVLIIYAVFSYNKETPFPGLYALVPTLGTVLIILFATQQTSVGKFIGNKAFVGVGLISYSAYLWHQPVFAFARHRSFYEPSPRIFLLLSILALVLAYLSWNFVESPFRSKDKFTRRTIFILAFVFSIGFVSFGLIGHFSGGFKHRFSDFTLLLENPKKGFSESCKDDAHKKPCLLGDQDSDPQVAILGDSHSAVLRSELSNAFASKGKSILSFEGAWCAPLIDFGTADVQKRPECRKFMANSFDYLLNNKEIDKVVLFAQWSNYTKGYRWDDSGIAYYTDSLSTSTSLEESIAAFERSLIRTVRQLKEAGKSIYIVKSVPEYSVLVPKLLAKNYTLSGNLTLKGFEINRFLYFDRNSEIEEIFSKINLSNVHFIDTYSLFCAGDELCDYADSSGSYYTDGNHLSVVGSRRLVPAIINSLGM